MGVTDGRRGRTRGSGIRALRAALRLAEVEGFVLRRSPGQSELGRQSTRVLDARIQQLPHLGLAKQLRSGALAQRDDLVSLPATRVNPEQRERRIQVRARVHRSANEGLDFPFAARVEQQ